MKVMFLAGAIPHYYNLVLNKLNKFENIEVIVVVPRKISSTVGDGVYQTQKGIEFKLFYVEEYKTFYGKMFFRGIETLIEQEKPKIIVSNWPYTLAWVFFPLLYLKIKQKHIKLISKEIPFQVPYYNDALSYYSNGGGVSDDNQIRIKKTGLFAKLRFVFARELRKRMVNLVDAHINYFDEAVEIQKSYGVIKEKVFITANSPDTDILFEVKQKILKEKPLLSINPYRIIHVGRLVKWKKVDMLIEIIHGLKNKFSTLELIIIGTGPEENNLMDLVQKLKLQNHVRFIGGVYDIEILGKYLLESSLYVLAGMGGLSINEAMTFGLPVVCSVADGTERKLVRESQNGFYFEEGNPDSLLVVVDKMLDNLDLTKKMGKESARIISEEINIHTVLKKYLEAFEFVKKK